MSIHLIHKGESKMSTHRLFISQPMKDKTNEQIEAERKRAIEAAQNYVNAQLGVPEGERKIEVIDSFFKDAPHDAKPLWYLGESFKLLATADIVFFVKGWDQYRGCKMENKAAHEYLEPAGAVIIEE